MERRLFLLMARAHRALTTYGNAQSYSALGISTSQVATLHHVSKQPGCSLTDLANLLDLNKSAVTGLVGRMESAGVVRRAANTKDARASHLFVTAKGEDVRTRSTALIRRLTRELTEGFTPSEVEVVVRFLNTLIERCGGATDDVEADA